LEMISIIKINKSRVSWNKRKIMEGIFLV
jgi:hypothetical protein